MNSFFKLAKLKANDPTKNPNSLKVTDNTHNNLCFHEQYTQQIRFPSVGKYHAITIWTDNSTILLLRRRLKGNKVSFIF